jgi:hypothetical protein
VFCTQLYKGYVGEFDYSEEDKVHHGKILYIVDLITFQADDWDGIQSAFEQSVDHYLEFCKTVGDTPNTPGVPGCLPIEQAPRDGMRIYVIRPSDLKPFEAWYSGPEYNSWHCETGGWFEHDEVHYWKPMT